jgi:hypothetical protein
MVLAHTGGYELIVPLMMLLGLLFIMRGGDAKLDRKPRWRQVTVAGLPTPRTSQPPAGRSGHWHGVPARRIA